MAKVEVNVENFPAEINEAITFYKNHAQAYQELNSAELLAKLKQISPENQTERAKLSEIIFAKNIGLVSRALFLAQNHSKSGITVGHFEEACDGLLRAISNYDNSVGAFSTFAMKIIISRIARQNVVDNYFKNEINKHTVSLEAQVSNELDKNDLTFGEVLRAEDCVENDIVYRDQFKFALKVIDDVFAEIFANRKDLNEFIHHYYGIGTTRKTGKELAEIYNVSLPQIHSWRGSAQWVLSRGFRKKPELKEKIEQALNACLELRYEMAREADNTCL